MDFLQLNTIHNRVGFLLHFVFYNSKYISFKKAPNNLVSCNNYHPALSLKLQVSIPINMLDDKHSFRDFNDAKYNSITLALTNNDWFTSFNHQPANISAAILQDSIFNYIQQFVPLKSFCWSFFPAWTSTELKSLLFRKNIAHKRFKNTYSIINYNFVIFSCFLVLTFSM